mgnify:FL=1
MSGFNSIQIRFKNIKEWQSPLSNTRTVPFVNSYLEVIKSCINDINTEYFWVFPSFMHCKEIEFDFIPEQFEKDQIHVWYTTHPLGGLNKEGHVLLIPTKQFKKQMKDLKFLRDFKDINYHEHSTLWQPSIMQVPFRLHDPLKAYNNSENYFYKWIYNRDLNESELPNFYPSFWEDLKVYSWGKTKDIMLVPHRENIKQFYDFDRTVHFDLDYNVRVMDIIFISYDEPSAEKRYNELKAKYPRAKWLKNIEGQTMAYHEAANMSDTDYFFAVFPKIEIVDSFKFDFQPDRMKNACHYIFNCKNPVNGLEYGHGAVLLYNKKLTLQTLRPSLDFTLSAPHDHVPILSAINHFNQTPWLAWRTAFREVIKLCQMKATVESKYRLKKWCELGTGDNADWVQKGALDAQAYYQKNSDNHEQLMLSYDFKWLKERYETEY